MKECKNILTYLKTDCLKPPKVPLTLARSKKSIHTYCLLIALRNFFLSLSVFSYFFVMLFVCGFQPYHLFVLCFPYFLQICFSIFLLQSFQVFRLSLRTRLHHFELFISIYTLGIYDKLSYTAGIITPQPHQQQKEISESLETNGVDGRAQWICKQ